MLKEARGHGRIEVTGAMRIYIPKDLVQSTLFPFKEETDGKKPLDVLIRIDTDKRSLVIERYASRHRA